MKTDDKKVKAIYDMQPPIDVSVVKDLHGRKHGKIPSYLSTILQSIREFARKEKAWQRSEDCEAAFQKIKKQTETPVLDYFDPGKEVHVVVKLDSECSKDGIGAVLLQDGKTCGVFN